MNNRAKTSPRDPQLQAEHAAQHLLPARCRPSLRHPPVLAGHQLQPLQPRLQIVAGRIVLPVLRYPEGAVQLPLAALIVLPGAPRGHLQHEVGSVRLLPQPIAVAVMVGCTKHHEHVRRHHRIALALLVVDEQVGSDVHVSPAAEVVAQRVARVRDRGKLKVAFRHRCAVGAGVINRGGSEYRAWHERASTQQQHTMR